MAHVCDPTWYHHSSSNNLIFCCLLENYFTAQTAKFWLTSILQMQNEALAVTFQLFTTLENEKIENYCQQQGIQMVSSFDDDQQNMIILHFQRPLRLDTCIIVPEHAVELYIAQVCYEPEYDTYYASGICKFKQFSCSFSIANHYDLILKEAIVGLPIELKKVAFMANMMNEPAREWLQASEGDEMVHIHSMSQFAIKNKALIPTQSLNLTSAVRCYDYVLTRVKLLSPASFIKVASMDISCKIHNDLFYSKSILMSMERFHSHPSLLFDNKLYKPDLVISKLLCYDYLQFRFEAVAEHDKLQVKETRLHKKLDFETIRNDWLMRIHVSTTFEVKWIITINNAILRFQSSNNPRRYSAELYNYSYFSLLSNIQDMGIIMPQGAKLKSCKSSKFYARMTSYLQITISDYTYDNQEIAVMELLYGTGYIHTSMGTIVFCIKPRLVKYQSALLLSKHYRDVKIVTQLDSF